MTKEELIKQLESLADTDEVFVTYSYQINPFGEYQWIKDSIDYVIDGVIIGENSLEPKTVN